MNNNLLDQYNSIIKRPNRWKYYQQMILPEDLFSNSANAKSFIESYFGAGNKSAVFDTGISLDSTRLFHIISVFFLGIHLSRNILNGVQRTNELKPDFRYLWYLACLYHDYGYFIEDNKNRFKPNDFPELSTLLDNFSVSNNLLSVEYPQKFTKQEIEGYYKYCIQQKNFINHGIIGGFLLYDRLVKNIAENHVDYKHANGQDTIKHFTHRGLIWGTHQYKFFQKVAWAIINHNIWFCINNEDSCEAVYQDSSYNLNGLILNNTNGFEMKHKKADDPLLFLLIIADTIEPVKDFRDLPVKCVLEKIKITSSPRKKEITIHVLDNCLDHNAWFEKIKDLETWVRIKVNYKGNMLTLSDF